MMALVLYILGYVMMVALINGAVTNAEIPRIPKSMVSVLAVFWPLLMMAVVAQILAIWCRGGQDEC